MELTLEERHGRGLGTKIANFLSRSRSRSRSKKRRSRSLDIDISCEPMPEIASLAAHARHSTFDPKEHEQPVASTSTSKPTARTHSRPLSSVIAPPVKQNKLTRTHSTRPSGSSRNPRPVDIRTEVVIVEHATPDSARKGKKMNIFGLSLSSPRKMSFSDIGKSRSQPPTPGGKSGERGIWAGRFRSDSHSAQPKQHDDVKDHVKGDILWDTNNPTSTTIPAAQTRCSPILVLNASNPQGDYAQIMEDNESERNGGRCSPLCGLPSPKLSASRSEKGKERERVRGARDRQCDVLDEKHHEKEREVQEGKAKEKERMRERDHITHPRRVGSPICRGHDRESKSHLGGGPLEKAASGSGTSRNSRGKDSATSSHPSPSAPAAKVKRIKHGSFDFERPLSAGTSSVSSRVADLSVTAPRPLARNSSARTTNRVRLVDSRGESRVPAPIASSSHSKGKTKLVLDLRTQDLPSNRRTTGSTAASQAHLRSQHSRQPHTAKPSHSSETEPGSPISSSHSGNSSTPNSSWGRSASKHMIGLAHPPFKFEPAVPPIPGSPASDERKRPVTSESSDSSGLPLSKSKQARMLGKGRSLDLGLGLSWAPSKIREDALLRTIGGSGANTALKTRARWRQVPPDEDGRLGASGTAADVAEAFHEALGDAAYSTFKTYVHRYDAHAIPLDGPFGLIQHVQRLLDNAPGLDERRNKQLLDRFIRAVQDNS
ncbi:hypothetical protein WOLCODRAFT_100578 [Wolfiporia cocos MD-104 SS10]|uniref:Uncharacterized protein n=1 Tax=Wolfiporia cocos (strain MD-104) TaxID=742152 RepID=A0A2H3JIU2_WOLCO|nr:hypothetical protein WOLCODRAFT_100578 [Wolfiporia cocos MD-104 SS10]